MKSKGDLIYDLIFSETSSYLIDMADYIDNINNYEEFVSEIKSILKKSEVEILKSTVLIDSKTAKWELNVKK